MKTVTKITKESLVILAMIPTFLFSGMIAEASEDRAPTSNTFSCQLKFRGLPFSATGSTQMAVINSIADACVRQLSSSDTPENIIEDCTNAVVSGCMPL